MATLFARAGGGNWSAAATWSLTSGGGATGSVPTSADECVLDAASGAVTIDAGGTRLCRSLNCTGYTNTLTHAAATTLQIGDGTAGTGNVALKFVAGMTYTLGNAGSSALSFVYTGSTAQTIDSGGKTVGNVSWGGASGGSWQLTGNALTGSTLAASFTLTRGTFDTNNQNMTMAVWASSNANTRTMTLGSSSITVGFGGAQSWQMGTVTNLTVTANTATVTMTGGATSFGSGAVNYNGMKLVASGSGAFGMNGGGCTLAQFTRTGTAAATEFVSFQSNFTVTTTITFTGANANTQRLMANSSTLGTQRTITCTGATINYSNCDFRDIVIAGAPTLGTNTSVGDCHNNSGITFTAQVTRFAVVAGNLGSTATWSNTTGGAGGQTVPLPQDIVNFDGASAAGTYTQNMQRFPGINFAGFTRTFASANAWEVYGSIDLASGMTLTATNTVTFIGTGTNVITTNGKTVTFACLFSRGTCGFGDDITNNRDAAGAIQVNLLANFTDNGHTVTVSGATAATVVFGSSLGASVTCTGTWNLNMTGRLTIWSAGTGVTYSTSTVTLVVGTASAMTRTIALGGGSGATYGTIRYTVTGSTGPLELTTNVSTSITTIECSDTALLKYPHLGYFDGATAGRYWDSGAVSNVNTATTSITLIACVSALDWTPGTSLYLAGWGTPSGASNTLSVYLYIDNAGLLGFQVMNSAASASFASTSAATGFTDGLATRRWVAAKLDVVAKTVNFYSSTNNPDNHPGYDVTTGGWSALGSTGRTFSPAWNGTFQSRTQAGISFNSATQGWAGDIFYAAGLKDSTTTPTWEVNAGNEAMAATTFSDDRGITWTATGAAVRVTRDRMLLATNGITLTVTNFLVSGVDANNLYPVGSLTSGSVTTLSKSSGTVVRSYLYLKDSTATGGAAWYAGRTSTNGGNNTGWLFVDFITSVLAAPLGSLVASITAFIPRTGEGSVVGVSTIVATGSARPPFTLTTVGILGCTESYAAFIANRAGHDLSNELPFTSLEWERVVSDTSTASVSIEGLSGPTLSECCALLEGVDAWKNELHIYRNGERIWAGPITGLDFEEETAEIRASDISAWWDRRRIHQDQHHVNTDLGEIFANYVADAMSVDNVPDVTVPVTHTGRIATRRVKAADRKICRPEIDELARTGLVWTVVNREIILGPAGHLAVTHLDDSHFRGPSSITIDGRMATNIAVVGAERAQGRPQVVGTAQQEEAAILEDYGVHEWVVSEDTVKDHASAKEAAERRLTRFELPSALFTGADLDPDFPLTQNELIPGRRLFCDLREQCRPVEGRYRLTKVSGTVGPETDTITMDVQPIGRGSNAL